MQPLTPIKSDFYGDDHRWFLGTVISSRPPSGLEGRVKIRIMGVHNESVIEIPEADLPWAQVMIPSTEGGISGIGKIPQILPGALVFGIFLDGTTSQLPLVLGSLPRVEVPNQRTSIAAAKNYGLIDDDIADADVNLRRQQTTKFFIDNGYELIHAASISGCIQTASYFRTYVETVTNDSVTVGIAQWKKNIAAGNRFYDLLNFSQGFNPARSWKLFSVQLEFVLFELRNKFSYANAKLLATNDIKNATNVINKQYLGNTNKSDIVAQLAYDEVIT